MPESARSSPAPPKNVSVEEELEYYRSQYESLEAELNEFQSSSRELEEALEKDLEASEKDQRKQREKIEALEFEVEEWKAKYRSLKTESNNAQNALQKEITTLRDLNRTYQLKLRDKEVENDDFERQARHKDSSIDDLESKYNVSIERGVLLEEEMRRSEQEREDLRIETQRQRDDLANLQIEVEITQRRLQEAEATIERLHTRKPTPLATESLRPPSPASEGSTSATTISSPTISTPPPGPKSNVSTVQTTPPSPPLSDASAKAGREFITPAKQRAADPIQTPMGAPPARVGQSTIRPPRHSRGGSVATTFSSSTRGKRPSFSASVPVNKPMPRFSSRPSISNNDRPPPRTDSLYHMRDLKSKAAKLGERVHRMHSKLPAPTTTPPRASPRSVTMGSVMPSSVTMRSSRKRSSHSTATSTDQPVSRLSFGVSTRGSGPPTDSRPSSRASGASAMNRPPSRTSLARPPSQNGIARPASRTSNVARPPSRTGTGIPTSGVPRSSSQLGYYSHSESLRRPRSPMSGSFAVLGSEARSGTPGPRCGTPGPRLGHGHSQSVSGMHSFTSASTSVTSDDEGSLITPVARRTTLEKGLSAIPLPASGLPRRQSGPPRRQSGAEGGVGDMLPPASRNRKLSEVGETF
ncbi:nuclear distribution protein nude [Venturia nashicola]|nr:nuclear distribution protein nude [Venturia nashicola]